MFNIFFYPVKSGLSEIEIEAIENEAILLLERLENGESFEKLAASHSAGQNALEGGFLGWRTSAELPSLFAQVVTGLAVGEVSQPLRSGAGFHILKLTEKRETSAKFLDQTLARHILVQPSEIRTENQAKMLINDIYNRLKEGEDFKQLARQFSEDPGSKMDGGELGWSNPGDYDPAFEMTLNATEIGQLSEPVKSSFGWHIIEVMDRRNEDVSQEEQKNRAYQIIFKRKFDQELQSTLIELRAEAYVDITNLMTKIAVSSGDPAGIGPDICIKAFGQKKSLGYRPVIFGNIDLLKERADEIKIKVDIKEYSGEDSNSLTDESLW